MLWRASLSPFCAIAERKTVTAKYSNGKYIVGGREKKREKMATGEKVNKFFGRCKTARCKD